MPGSASNDSPRPGRREPRWRCPLSVRLFAVGTVLAFRTVLALGATTLSACEPPVSPSSDAGVPELDGGGDGVSGRVEVRLELHTADSETALENGTFEIDRIRARSDRGEREEPRWDEVGTWDFEREVHLEAPGLPATYGGVLIEPATAVCQVLLQISHGDSTEFEICLSGLPPLDLRCESPAGLEAGANVRIEAEFELGDIGSLVADEAEDGDRIDVGTNPELHTALAAAWTSAWTARCESVSPGDET